MSLLTFSSVGMQFGADQLLSDVSFNVAPRERWGVVGRNGTGKTTLLHLITGDLDPTSGSISRRPGLRMTLLDQHRDFGDARTVWEAAAAGYRDLLTLERALEEETEGLGELGDAVTDGDLKRFDEAQERFLHRGGYEFHARVDAVLQGLGFDAEAATERRIEELSGGERGRVGLAAQLAAPADLLLLDEPTNHLDLDTIEWLKSHLKESEKTVLIISHDRAFLNDFADHILHVFQGSARAYRGGYSSFVRQRDRDILTQEREFEARQKEIARQEEFIRRNIAGQKTAQAKARRNRLARLPRLSPPPSEDDPMAVRFEISARGGDQVLMAEELTVAVENRVLVREFSGQARRGDVIALVGPNGAGKSTLLATLLGEREPDGGKVRRGSAITPAWFRQDHAHLPVNKTIFDCVADLRPIWNRGQIQDHLGRFGFSGDEVKRVTDSLSGGERARVALALITLQGSNLLALDEPTNHLDVESIEALEDALESYPGTVLLVSHDRALLRELTTRVWALRDGEVEDYPGPFVDWERKVAAEKEERIASELQVQRRAREAEKARARKAHESRKARNEPLRRARRAAAAAEEEVHEAEAAVGDLKEAMGHPDLYDGSPESAREAGRLTTALKEATERLDDAMARWETAVEALEEISDSGDDPS